MPISVLRNDVEKDLLLSGIQHLLFQLFQEIKTKNRLRHAGPVQFHIESVTLTNVLKAKFNW